MTTMEMISPAAVQTEVNQTQQEVLAFIDANKVAVTDQASLIRANSVRKAIGVKQKAIVAQLAKPKGWAHGLHTWFCSLEKALSQPLQILDTYEANEIRRFNDAVTKQREEQERALAEERRRADHERATAEAAALERLGEHQLAAAVVEEAIAAPPPVVVLPDEVRAVQSFRRTWHFEIVKEALVPREFCVPDEKKLRHHAIDHQGTAAVPGVRFYYTDHPIR
jgi:hypothetical protein